MAKQKNNLTPDAEALKKAFTEMQKVMNSGMELSEYMGKTDTLIGSISSQLFGISENKFFTKIQATEQVWKDMLKSVSELDEQINNMSVSLNTGFNNAIKTFSRFGGNITDITKNMIPEMAQQVQDAVESMDFTKMSHETRKQFIDLVEDKKGFKTFAKFFNEDLSKDLAKAQNDLAGVRAKMDSVGTSVMSWGKSLDAFGERLTKGFNLSAIATSIGDFDQAMSDAQITSGIMYKNNSAGMMDLVTENQRYGMGLKENIELVNGLGATLRTTSFDVLSGAAKDMEAIAKQTGLSVAQTANLGGEIMLYGKSSKYVKDLTEATMKDAIAYGVNGHKIMEDITKHMPMFRQMGYMGIENLRKMSITAEHLGQSLDEVFDMTKRARTIEGSLEMASRLALLGGKFNANPMDLLAAARKNPAEMQKILGQMGSDIGNFNKKTGETTFDAGIDYDKFSQFQEISGISVDNMQKQIRQMNIDTENTRKITASTLPGMFDGLDEKEKAFLLSHMGQDGTLKLDGKNIDVLAQVSKTSISAAMTISENNRKTQEEQAQNNISMKDSMKFFKDSIMGVFIGLEPLIKIITSIIQGFNNVFAKLDSGWKMLIAGLTAVFALFFGAQKQILSGFWFGKGFSRATGIGAEKGGGILGFFKKNKGGDGKIPLQEESGKLPKDGAQKGWLESLGDGLAVWGKKAKDIFIGAATVAASAVLVTAGIVAISYGISAMGDPSGKQILMFGGILVGLAGSLYLASKIPVNKEGLLELTLSMALVGLAFLPFAHAMKTLQNVSWSSMFGSIIMAGVAIAAVSAIGASIEVTAPLLLAGALVLGLAGAGLLLFGSILQQAAPGFQEISKINWNSFSQMSGAMLQIAEAGLIGVVGALGIKLLSWSLGSLADVADRLDTPLTNSAAAITAMGTGITSLKSALKDLDTSKLESLASVSEKLSTGSIFSNLAGAISSITGSKQEEKQKEITIKLEPVELRINGRFLQELILKDTKIIS